MALADAKKKWWGSKEEAKKRRGRESIPVEATC
jgi:hypothetical protein